ncbi:N-acetyltransferase family protein [Ekhidna sp.]
MDDIQISELTSKSEFDYLALVRHALINDHDCFRISPNDDLDIHFNINDSKEEFTLGAFLDGKLIGVVSFKREGTNREKLRHKGLLTRMIVAEEHRGKGIGKHLISEVIKRAKMINGIEQINLTVIPTNEKAKWLYEQFGFITYASEKNAIKWNGNYYTEDQMALELLS